jgi:type IV pilus assembly protein PilB
MRTDHQEEPIIKFVDQTLQHALQKSASDIHIEPFATHCRIRYRQDGVLYQIAEITPLFAARVITRLKIMAQLNIAERRLPQDGRFQIGEPMSADIRMSCCPTIFGEKIVLRLAPAENSRLEINELGFTNEQQKIFLEKISSAQGIILVTGPTGSGKTATLYAALRLLNTSEKNISTIEDPVEIQLAGINQVNINPKIGLDFATALRTFLRQDPDILMLGEIRDQETAAIAVQAAQTGHLVLTTLHTNSALETFHRLQSLGLETYQLSHAITLIISQRLARKLCPLCKTPATLSTATQFEIDLTEGHEAYTAQGCAHCLYGYRGRTGIYEFLTLNETTLQQLVNNKDTAAVNHYLLQNGFLSLRAAGLAKVREGITSYAEINRIISP